MDTASRTPLPLNFVAYIIMLPFGAILGDSSNEVFVKGMTLNVSILSTAI
jgi:hypothetical protein